MSMLSSLLSFGFGEGTEREETREDEERRPERENSLNLRSSCGVSEQILCKGRKLFFQTPCFLPDQRVIERARVQATQIEKRAPGLVAMDTPSELFFHCKTSTTTLVLCSIFISAFAHFLDRKNLPSLVVAS